MFAKERQRGNSDASGFDVLHFGCFDYVLETALFQQQLERGILQLSAPIAWNNDVLDLMANLQKRLEEHMILVIVGDQHVVNGVRQVKIGISRNAVLVGIT